MSKELPTFIGRGTSIIDLLFTSTPLVNSFISYLIYKPLYFNLDYEPILSTFLLNTSLSLKNVSPTRVFRTQDTELIARLALDLPKVPSCNSPRELDNYLLLLHNSLDNIVSLAVPMSSTKPLSFKAKWQTKEVKDSILEEREARKKQIRTRTTLNKETLQEKIAIKNSLIKITKRK